jgi:hypothetical protein
VKRFHLIFGLLLVIVFLLTGQYMDRFHNHLEGMADGPRMLYRSRHIYILLTGLLHLGVGTYIVERVHQKQRVVQLIGSLMLTIAPILFLFGFFKEPLLTELNNPFSQKGVYLVAAGVVLHLLSGINDGNTKE